METATAFAIALAKAQRVEEVSPDHLLLGCLRTISRFGVAEFGAAVIDLEAFGFDWLKAPETSRAKVSYSDGVVRILDRAALIARSDGAQKVGLDHLLAAFANEADGLAAEIRSTHGINSAMWRSASASIVVRSAATVTETAPEYLSPEDAAVELGIHVQTVRTYVRSGKLPALRLAGERAIRIRREDLHKLMEPVQPEV